MDSGLHADIDAWDVCGSCGAELDGSSYYREGVEANLRKPLTLGA